MRQLSQSIYEMVNLLIILCFSFSCTNMQSPKDYLPLLKDTETLKSNTDSCWVVFADSTTNNCDIKYTNKFGDNISIGLQGKEIFSFPLDRFNIVSVSSNGKSFQVPCFPNDTIFINPESINWKWKYAKRDIKQFDTTFFKFSFIRNKKDFESINQLKVLMRGPSLTPDKKVFIVKSDIKNKKSFYSEFSKSVKKLCDVQLAQLDSFKNKELINKEFYGMYQSIIVSSYLNEIILSYNQTKDSTITKILFNENHYLNDSYLEYDIGPFKSMINNYLWSIVGGENIKKEGNAVILDYGKVFDSSEKYLKSKILEYVKYYCLTQMRIQYSKDIFNEYYGRFKQTIQDSNLISYASMKFLNVDVVDVNDKIIYENNEETELNTLLSNLKGKYVLIDIWASWCAPCRSSINESRRFLKTIDSEKFKIFYISIDEELINWKKASIIEKLNLNGISVRLKNPQNSYFLKKLNITTIPKYILLDTKGAIIYTDSSSPTSEAFKKVLRKHNLL